MDVVCITDLNLDSFVIIISSVFTRGVVYPTTRFKPASARATVYSLQVAVVQSIESKLSPTTNPLFLFELIYKLSMELKISRISHAVSTAILISSILNSYMYINMFVGIVESETLDLSTNIKTAASVLYRMHT